MRTMHHESNTELAIPELQRRLAMLGYHLGDEAEKGVFGERTATAVAAFKEANDLGFDYVVDQTTWTALKDASMQIGDRLLYLHMPHFRGRDVSELQGALSSMGFACALDGSFGPETEQALRDFQDNMCLDPTGILDDDSLDAILRLRHLWDGKRGFIVAGRVLTAARCATVLEDTCVCVFGTDEATRAIANRVANLARATTVKSRIVSASALATEPGKDMLLVGLEQSPVVQVGKDSADHEEGDRGERGSMIDYRDDGGGDKGDPLRDFPETSTAWDASKTPVAQDFSETPVVHIGVGGHTEAELKKAIRIAREGQNRLTMVIDIKIREGEDATVRDQAIAVDILDLLCGVLE